MTDGTPPGKGALVGIRVLDLSGELAAYASRLLGDLGADITRVEQPGGSVTRHAAPIVYGHREAAGIGTGGDDTAVSAFDRFVNAGKKSITLDITVPDGRSILERLARAADVLIETWSMAEADRWGLSPTQLRAVNPRLVHASVTPFGRDRPRPPVNDDDLTVMAAGGLLNLGGYPDSEPLVAHGAQSGNAASLFAAVGVLTALLERERTGCGQWIDVSAQECVAQALEDSVASYEMTGRIRRRHGSEPAEAGTGMYACQDGLVSMVAGRVGTARAWKTLIAWLVEEGVADADELTEPAWSTLAHRQTPAAIDRFGQIFGSFTAGRSRLWLYGEAQGRGIALSPVNDIAGVLDDPQLRARDFWVQVHDPDTGRDTVFPGPPYRLSATPARGAQPTRNAGADTSRVLCDDLGLDDEHLQGLREAGVI